MADELNSENEAHTILEDTTEIPNNIEFGDNGIQLKTESNQNVDILDQKDNKTIKEEFNSSIINGFKKLKEETGCTSEELIELLMNIEDENEIHEEEEEEAPDAEVDEYEQDYGSAEYWEDRYTICPQTFDWYQKWDAIYRELYQIFTGDELVLNIGCGNSEMSADMQETAFKTVVSIDISGVVIDQMIAKYKDNEDLLWFEMDCTKLTFEDEFFDVVFDKGTFDAILCGEKAIKNIYLSMGEIWRVLKYGGLFIEITYGEPSQRLGLFKHSRLSWKLYEPIFLEGLNNNSNEANNQDSDNSHYIYVFQKLFNYEEDITDDDIINNNYSENDNESNFENDCANDNNNGKCIKENDNNENTSIGYNISKIDN